MNKKSKKNPVVTKKPDGTTGMRLTQQEVNFGNVERTKLEVLGNLNTNLLEVTRDIAEIKESNKQVVKLLKKLVKNAAS